MSRTKIAAAAALLAAAAPALTGCGLIDDVVRLASKGDEAVEAGVAATKADEVKTASQSADSAPPAAARADEEVPPVVGEARDQALEAVAEQEMQGEDE